MEMANRKMKLTDKMRNESYLVLILKLAAAMNVTLSEATQTVYLEQLLSLELHDLSQAVNRTIQEWDKPHMMPPIAFILARSPANPQLLAEQAWDWTKNYIRRHWHIDIGHFQGAPAIPAATEYAIRQVGGLSRIAYPNDRDLDFIRRGFLEAHQRFITEDGEQVKLSHADASRFLGNLRIAANSGLSALPAVVEPKKEA